jgi:branched-subunit amino acid transport protein
VTAFFLLAGAGIVSWVLRALFITLVPARNLPERFRGALTSAGPAAMAALLAAEFSHTQSVENTVLAPWVIGAIIAALLAHRLENLGVTVVGGTVAYGLVTLVQ